MIPCLVLLYIIQNTFIQLDTTIGSRLEYRLFDIIIAYFLTFYIVMYYCLLLDIFVYYDRLLDIVILCIY